MRKEIEEIKKTMLKVWRENKGNGNSTKVGRMRGSQGSAGCSVRTSVGGDSGVPGMGR